MLNLCDSHAHLSELPDIEGIMSRAYAAGVTRILNICTDPLTLKRGFELQGRFPEICNAGATTPHDVDKEGESAFPIFAEAALAKKIIAIGETGLDYHYQHSDRATQKRFLIRYLHLAAECRLPVIFHCREAFEDLFAIVDAEYPKTAPAVLHCFTGTIREAEQVLCRNWFLSLSGIVTFKKSESLREVAKMVPLPQLLIETDAPFLAPQSRRGQPNEPSFLPETCACIAAAKQITPEEVALATAANAYTLMTFEARKLPN